MKCFACRRGDGPMSLHHWDDEGCHGSYGGATFTLEPDPDPENSTLHVRRIEPALAPPTPEGDDDAG